MSVDFPPLDFPAFGLDGTWTAPRWLAHVDGIPGYAVTTLALAHGHRPSPSPENAWVYVQSIREPHGQGVNHPPAFEDLAFKGLVTLFNLLFPALVETDSKRKYLLNGMALMQRWASGQGPWKAADWRVDGTRTEAKYIMFSDGWAGVVQPLPGVGVAVSAYGLSPADLGIERLTASANYHFDIQAGLRSPDASIAARRAALGACDAGASKIDWPLHDDMRRILDSVADT